MAVMICGDTLTDAWLADLEYLHRHGEQLNFITTIADPDPDRVDEGIVAGLDNWLLRKQKQSVGTVANTIFPSAYLRGSSSRQQLYERYHALLPRLRKQRGNGHGTYFGRLMEYPASADVKHGETMNQIEGIIEKLQTQLRGQRPKRFAYQAQIFAPGRDDTSLMGFPCLSSVSFQLDRPCLCLTAVYRNQYYFERALGNFLGLAHLQRFVAQATGLALGSLTVHACHAEIEDKAIGKQEAEQLIRACRGATSVAVAA
jgi:thymidylate synthase